MFDTLIHTVLFARVLAIYAADNLIAFTPRACCVLASKHEDVGERCDEADADVCEHNPVPERVPWLIYCTVHVRRYCAVQVATLDIIRDAVRAEEDGDAHKPIAMPRTSPRLYEPSELQDIQALCM